MVICETVFSLHSGLKHFDAAETLEITDLSDWTDPRQSIEKGTAPAFPTKHWHTN